jgi:phosphoribosylanthranilate isomerase
MLKTNVLAGPITNLTDARYFAARGVQWLLFDLDESSENFIAPQRMRAIREWVDGVQIVGAFELAEAGEIRVAVEQWKLNAVLLGMLTPLETAQNLAGQVPVFKEIVIEQTMTAVDLKTIFETWQQVVQFFVLNFYKNNIDWVLLNENKPLTVGTLAKFCEKFSLMLGIDLQVEMLKEERNMLLLRNLYVRGGVEEKTGYKSFEALDEIFDALEMQ